VLLLELNRGYELAFLSGERRLFLDTFFFFVSEYLFFIILVLLFFMHPPLEFLLFSCFFSGREYVSYIDCLVDRRFGGILRLLHALSRFRYQPVLY